MKKYYVHVGLIKFPRANISDDDDDDDPAQTVMTSCTGSKIKADITTTG